MEDGAALRLALDLLHIPWRVKVVRSEPLPDGVPLLLRIAAGERDAQLLAAQMVDRSHDVVCEAAAFFIEQILLCPEVDSYRALGTTPAATTAELRRNMAWLMAWLHPDMAREGQQSVFVARVTKAWNDLKTPERRAAYDAMLRAKPSQDGRTRLRGDRRRGSAIVSRRRQSAVAMGRFGRVLSILFGWRSF
jgi:hypothetical protein